MIDRFCAPQSICLNVGLRQGNFVWKCCVFSLHLRFQYFQLKNHTLVFWKRFLFCRKFVSKLKYWKRSNFPVIVTWKLGDFLNGGQFWKSRVLFFRRTYALSLACWIKTIRKSVHLLPQNLLKEATPHFLSIWWIIIFKHIYSLIFGDGIYKT